MTTSPPTTVRLQDIKWEVNNPTDSSKYQVKLDLHVYRPGSIVADYIVADYTLLLLSRLYIETRPDMTGPTGRDVGGFTCGTTCKYV